MLYIIADKQKAAIAGISPEGHNINGGHIILNEKELNVIDGATLEERAEAVDGVIFSLHEIKNKIIKGDW